MLQGTIALFTQGKGLDGVDQSKPWGVILQTDGQQFLPVGCIAVTDINKVLAIVQGFGAQIKDGADGAKQIALPNGQTIHLRNRTAGPTSARREAALASLPADPAAELNKIVADYDLGARIAVQNVPEQYRQMAVQAMKSGMEDGLKKKDDESDEDYESRRKLAEAQVAQLETMVNEIDEIVTGWAIDSTQQKTFLDFTYRFLPGSKMAKQIAGYGTPKTNFAGFFQPDAAATLTFASQADPETIKENIDQMRATMDTMRKQAEKAIDEEEDIPDDETRTAVKAALGDFMDAFQATMESGQMDGGAALHLGADKLTLVAGAQIKEPAKFESGLKKLAAIAEKEPDFNGVQWNAATHEGVNFHTLAVPVPADEAEARKMFGEKVDVAIGIGTEAVYVAVGQRQSRRREESDRRLEGRTEQGSAAVRVLRCRSVRSWKSPPPIAKEDERRDAPGDRRHAQERRPRPRPRPRQRHAHRERPQVPLRSRRRRPPRHRQGRDDGPAKGPAGSHAGAVAMAASLSDCARECACSLGFST